MGIKALYVYFESGGGDGGGLYQINKLAGWMVVK